MPKQIATCCVLQHLVETARILEPQTLRARFGVNDVSCLTAASKVIMSSSLADLACLRCSYQVKNALHCTDLPEDGGIESRYFFQLLQTA